MKQTLPLLMLATCFVGCGGDLDRVERYTGEVLDTVTYRAELDSAKHLLRRSDMDGLERLIAPILEGTESRPAQRNQRLQALSLQGQVYQRRSHIDSALACYEDALIIAGTASDTFWMGTAWLNIGVAREIQGDYAGAMEAGLNALRWKELVGDSLSLARILNNMSILQWRRDSIQEAVALLERSLAIKRRLDPAGVAGGLNGLGVLLIEEQRYDTAITVLKESLALQDSLRASTEQEVQLSNIGLAYERAGTLDSAVHYYEAALLGARANGNSEVEIRALYGLGDVRRTQGKLAEARPLLDSSLAISQRIGSLEDMKEAHISLMHLHEKLNDPETALEHFRAYHELNDSLMNEATRAEMAELQLRYDTGQKDRENADLRTAQELTSLRADRNRWTAIGIGVLALAIVVLAWTIVQRNRARARQREAELEQEALRLQMDPHFLFNALNTIPGLYASGDAATANDHVGHLSRFLRLVLETSRRRTIPLQQEVELVEHYLRISSNRKPDSFTWEVKVMPYVQAERIAVPPMLIQPVVENAIEHGFSGHTKGHLSVLVDRAGSVLHIEVKDDGKGRTHAAQRPTRRNGTSMGIDLVRKRIALFDRATTMTEAVEVRDGTAADGTPRGTTVTIRLRVQMMSEHAAVGDR